MEPRREKSPLNNRPEEPAKRQTSTDSKNSSSDNLSSEIPFILSSLNSIKNEVNKLRELVIKEEKDEDDPVALRKFSEGTLWTPNKIDEEITRTKTVLNAEKQFKEHIPYIICLTGGPCAGKTSAIAHITEMLKQRGYQVFTVPEAATMIHGSGANILLDKYSDINKIKFQYYLMQLQMVLEDIFSNISATTESSRIVILCDRGLMDGSAYMSPELWQQLLNEYGINESKIRDMRYGMVIHMTTAADGAEKFYRLDNNEARSENLEVAIKLDRALMRAWVDHPNFVCITNKGTKNFQDKLDAVLQAVFKYLGEPLSTTFLKKYLVANPFKNLAELLAAQEKINVQTFEIIDYVFFLEETNEFHYYRSQVF